MNLELTAEEVEVLSTALRSYIGDLRMEIADTDRVEMRTTLKHEKTVLDSLLDRMAAGASPAP